METIVLRELLINYGTTKEVRTSLKSPEDVSEVIRSLLPDNSREHFIALYLNGSHNIVSYSLVSTGSANSTTLHPREIFQPAIACGAVAIIVSHNHPSGNVQPSKQDMEVTQKIKSICDTLQIKFLDHVIVTNENHYSFKEDSNFCF